MGSEKEIMVTIPLAEYTELVCDREKMFILSDYIIKTEYPFKKDMKIILGIEEV